MFENKVRALLAEGKAARGAGLPDRTAFIAHPTVETGIGFLWIDTECDATGIPWIPVLGGMNSKPAGKPMIPGAGSL